MSSIVFAASARSASVPGGERARGAHLVGVVTARVLELDDMPGRYRSKRILPDDFFEMRRLLQRTHEGQIFSDSFGMWLSTAGMFGDGGGQMRITPGSSLDLDLSLEQAETQGAAETALNTAIVYGTDEEALLAHLHGSVEDGIVVPAEHRTWLAGLIRGAFGNPGLAVADGTAARWCSVADLLDDISGAPGAVLVTSSQGRDLASFAGEIEGISAIDDPDLRYQAWEDWRERWEQLSADEMFARYIGPIVTARAGKPWLRLEPGTFRIPSYARGYTAQDAVAAADAWLRRADVQRAEGARQLIEQAAPSSRSATPGETTSEGSARGFDDGFAAAPEGAVVRPADFVVQRFDAAFFRDATGRIGSVPLLGGGDRGGRKLGSSFFGAAQALDDAAGLAHAVAAPASTAATPEHLVPEDVPMAVIGTTVIAVTHLLETDPDAAAELHDWAHDPATVLTDRAREAIDKLALTDHTGKLHNAVGHIVRAALVRDGGGVLRIRRAQELIRERKQR